MRLPGGLCEGDSRQTDARFRETTGAMVLDLESCVGIVDPIERVTAILSAALATVGDSPATSDRITRLCVDDRRWLMLQLSGLMGVAPIWLTGRCAACDAAFDVPLDPASVPVKPAGPSYPFADVSTSRGPLRVRVPTGEDQHAIAGLDERDAIEQLIDHCCVDGGSRPARALSAADLRRISRALEDVSPQVALAISTACPTCRTPAELSFDPYELPLVDADAILDDVHLIARGYGWSEATILAMPARRRAEYLRRLERDAQ
jgi:hypothetical protein